MSMSPDGVTALAASGRVADRAQHPEGELARLRERRRDMRLHIDRDRPRGLPQKCLGLDVHRRRVDAHDGAGNDLAAGGAGGFREHV